VTSVVRDAQARTLTITARLDASIERVWQLWSDPRQLERWWGPPSFPATVTEHELVPGGSVAYAMTGPDGERHHGRWRVLAVDPPHTLTFEDTAPELPTGTVRAALSALPEGGTEMVITAGWDSAEAMRRIFDTGTDTGMTEAVGQIDALLTTRRAT
jgi:uncharacterized protein YndB with AHSA1/START domain